MNIRVSPGRGGLPSDGRFILEIGGLDVNLWLSDQSSGVTCLIISMLCTRRSIFSAACGSSSCVCKVPTSKRSSERTRTGLL